MRAVLLFLKKCVKKLKVQGCIFTDIGISADTGELHPWVWVIPVTQTGNRNLSRILQWCELEQLTFSSFFPFTS